MVAVVILSIGIVLVLRAFDTSLIALHDSRDTLRAFLVIRNRMADVRLAAVSGQESELEALRGTFTAGEDYRGRIRIESERDGMGAGTQAPGQLHRVTITVWHQDGTFRHTAATYVRVPPEPDEDGETGR